MHALPNEQVKLFVYVNDGIAEHGRTRNQRYDDEQ